MHVMATERMAGGKDITKEIPADQAVEAAVLYSLANDVFRQMDLKKIEEQPAGVDPFAETKISVTGPEGAVEVFNTMMSYGRALRTYGVPKDNIPWGKYARQAIMDVLGTLQADVAAQGGVRLKSLGGVRMEGSVTGRKKVDRREVGNEGEEIKTDSGHIELKLGKQIVLQKFTRTTWAPCLDLSGVKEEASDKEIGPGKRLMRRVSVEGGELVVRLVQYQVVEADVVVENLEETDVLQWLA